jgi:hypothetical protein
MFTGRTMNFNNGGFIRQNDRVEDIYGNVHFTAFNIIPKTGNPDHTPSAPRSTPKPNINVAGGALAEHGGGPHAIFGKNFTLERRLGTPEYKPSKTTH